MTGSAESPLAPAELALTLAILRAHLPAGSRVWAFGSRAAGRAKPYSDLDLAIDAGRRLTLDEFAALREAFSESDLPWMVDLTDWRAVDAGFAALIGAQRVEILARA